MRILVLILAILGGLGSGFLGYKWYGDAQRLKEPIDAVRGAAEATPEGKAKLAEFDRLVMSSYFLMAGALVAVVGGILAMNGRGLIAGVLMLAVVAVPVVLSQKPEMLIFNGLLGVAGVLALFCGKRSPGSS